MGIKDFFKGFILRMDMLSAQPILRANGESSFETYCGGTLSIIIMIAFSVIFYSSFLSVIGKLEISYTQTFQDDPTSSSTISSLNIAVGINGVDLSSSALKKFSVSLSQMNVMPGGNTRTPVMLSACNVSDWAPLGSNFDKQFNGFGFNEMLCITNNQSYTLFGYSGSMPYQFMNLQINLCNATYPGCDTTANSLTWMTNYLNSTAANNIFQVRLFIVNTIVSPTKSKPISSIIQKNIIVTFTKTTGTMGYAHIGDFTLSTDSSILPYTDYSYQTGTFLDTYTTTTIPISSPTTSNLVQFQFYKSTKSLTVARSFGKIDSLLSYAGGLFSLMFTIIAFFFASYSQYSYELYIGQHSFSLDKSGKKLKESEFNFLIYLKYCFYDWVSTFGVNPNWEKDIKIHEIRNEANSIMNVSLILRRIQHLQNISQVLLEEHKLISLYLSKPPTLQEAKKMRQSITFYDEMINRFDEVKQMSAINPRQIISQNMTKQFIQFNDASCNPKETIKITSQIFNEDNEVDMRFLNALKELKNQNDEQSIKIKEKLFGELLERVNDDNTQLKMSLKKSNISFQMINLENSGEF